MTLLLSVKVDIIIVVVVWEWRRRDGSCISVMLCLGSSPLAIAIAANVARA